MFLYYLRIVGFNRLVWGYPGIIGKIVQEGYLVKKLLFGAFGQMFPDAYKAVFAN